MAEAINEAELGRSKHSSSPEEHLKHLLKIGWDPQSPLIKKYVAENGLGEELVQWLQDIEEERLLNPSPTSEAQGS